MDKLKYIFNKTDGAAEETLGPGVTDINGWVSKTL